MTNGLRILVVDDEPQICRSLQVGLGAQGYSITIAESGEQALEVLQAKKPELAIVDLLLPGMTGIELTQRIREQFPIPIIVLSAIGEEPKKVEALEQGADDYVTKPFGMNELLARIRTVLRRVTNPKNLQPTFQYKSLSINFNRREVSLDHQLVKLTPKEYDLLTFMIHHAGKVLTRRMILTAVWGPGYENQAQYLRVFVGHLRKKLEKSPTEPQFILTDPGVGYRFNVEE